LDIKGIELEKVQTNIEENVLRIRMPAGTDNRNVRGKAVVYYSELRFIASYTSAVITSNEIFKQDNLELKAGSGGEMYLKIDLENISIKSSEGGLIFLSGQVKEQKINVLSGGVVSAFELICDSVIVKATTGGKARIVANEYLKAIATTGGYISYKGNPSNISVKEKLGGDVSKSEN